ncbi:hypothetical protein [Thioclava sp. GXIMD4215]|uniref:hypothetical protein n=1 Tax=Thioclava sp. GXIMD4215 TaxID=3131928 RepID=UPI00324EE0BC
MADLTQADLRAAVAAGHLTEAQAASVQALAAARASHRAAEDEPFELFRGFAEIFVTVGLGILIAGAFGLTLTAGVLLPDPQTVFATGVVAIYAVWAVIAWCLAEYFTRRRRMVLPSILLVLTYGASVMPPMIWALGHVYDLQSSPKAVVLTLAVLMAGALAAWYRRFRLPFTMVLIALCGLAGCFVIFGSTNDLFTAPFTSFNETMDLRNSTLALGTLIFGLVAFAGGMWFDTRDPYRMGRASASGFWLHLCAAPALVNTLAMTFIGMGPGLGYALLGLSLGLIAMLALVIDRRSFLTVGIGYLIFLVSWLTDAETPTRSWFEVSATVLFFTGIVLTALGAFWTDLRIALMRALPDFPGKAHLPPYKTE